MPMGPVQLLVIGFEDPEFKGDDPRRSSTSCATAT